MIGFNTKVRMYPYRTAMVRDWDITIPRDDRLLARLARKTTEKWNPSEGKWESVNGVDPDNHVVFVVGETPVWVEDSEMILGGKVEVM